MENLQKILLELGFNETEAQIYLSVVKYGKSTVTDIAKNSGLKRPTIYQYIDDLTGKDLLRKTFLGKRLYYFPEDPKRLIKYAENIKERVSSVFPELQAMFTKSASKPVVRFYEGKESVRSVYREMTNTSKTLWSVFSAERYFQTFSEKDGEEFLDNVNKNGGQIKDLVLNSPQGLKYVKENWAKGIATSKILPKDFQFIVDMQITGNKVAMISFDNMIAVIIESQEIADLQMQFINFVWKHI